jgi:hypothetical protein
MSAAFGLLFMACCSYLFLQWVQKQMITVLEDMPDEERALHNVQLQCAYMNYNYFSKSSEAGRMICESLEARKNKVCSFVVHRVCYLILAA